MKYMPILILCVIITACEGRKNSNDDLQIRLNEILMATEDHNRDRIIKSLDGIIVEDGYFPGDGAYIVWPIDDTHKHEISAATFADKNITVPKNRNIERRENGYIVDISTDRKESVTLTLSNNQEGKMVLTYFRHSNAKK